MEVREVSRARDQQEVREASGGLTPGGLTGVEGLRSCWTEPSGSAGAVTRLMEVKLNSLGSVSGSTAFFGGGSGTRDQDLNHRP